MAEIKNVEEVIREGLAAWRRNLILGLPFLLNMIAGFFLMVAYVVFVYFLANPFSNLETGNIYSIMQSINWLILFLDLLLALILFVLMIIISSFFASGAIGMAYSALTKGETSLDDLFNYGRKHFFIKVLLANFAIFIIMFFVLAMVFIVQMILGGEYINIATLILGMLFAPVPYAIVISSYGVREGLKKGTHVAWNNKLDTVLVYIFVTTLTSFVSVIAFAVMGLIAALVIALIPLQELSWVGITTAILASVPIIAGGLIIAFIVYVAALILVAEPIVTVCWANYYLSKKENE